ncbi:MAG: trypsin-like serine protease [Clostridiales bacterium]|jgi:V8-like Glu-specific endopeptidase|nr:trypsin-like serine protease [Clostridiales bacterium]
MKKLRNAVNLVLSAVLALSTSASVYAGSFADSLSADKVKSLSPEEIIALPVGDFQSLLEYLKSSPEEVKNSLSPAALKEARRRQRYAYAIYDPEFDYDPAKIHNMYNLDAMPQFEKEETVRKLQSKIVNAGNADKIAGYLSGKPITMYEMFTLLERRRLEVGEDENGFVSLCDDPADFVSALKPYEPRGPEYYEKLRGQTPPEPALKPETRNSAAEIEPYNWGDQKDDRSFITDTNPHPYSAICQTTVVYEDGTSAMGSGVMVGDDLLLTAAHGIYTKEELVMNPKRAASVLVMFGGNNSDYSPSIECNIDVLYCGYDEVSGSKTADLYQNDYALIKLRAKTKSQYAETGHMKTQFLTDSVLGKRMDAYGYDQDKFDNNRVPLAISKGLAASTNQATGPYVIYGDAYIQKSESGGPVVIPEAGFGNDAVLGLISGFGDETEYGLPSAGCRMTRFLLIKPNIVSLIKQFS